MSRTLPRAPWQLRALLGLLAVTAPGDRYEVGREISALAGGFAAPQSTCRSPHPAGQATDPWLDIPGQFSPGTADPVPAVADVALAPGWPADADGSGQFPEGISPLPVTAVSGGPCRPQRLLYRDGTAVDCRPIGHDPVWTGITAGVIPATGNLAPGWLQVVRRDDDDLLAVHPALISPWSVDPYAWIPYRQRVRFRAFDATEAAGLPAAGLLAVLVDPGDRIRAGHPRAGQPEMREVLDVHTTDGATVMIASGDPADGIIIQEYPARDTVDVMIPHRHPGEDGPQALCLFAQPAPVTSRSGHRRKQRSAQREVECGDQRGEVAPPGGSRPDRPGPADNGVPDQRVPGHFAG